MPTPVQAAQYRRDEARGRTRRLSWLIGGGATAASLALGAVFAQLLPGHSAAATTGSTPPAAPASGQASPPAGTSAPSGSKAASGQQRHRAAASQPAAPPAPVQSQPQVVSGGS